MCRSLYIKYGSRITSGTAELLYDRITQDPSLAGFFINVDINKLREHMSDVLGVIAGGPNIYKGRNIKEAHAQFAITRADFDNVAAHLSASLAVMGVEPDDIDIVLAEVAKTADDVITIKP